MSSNLSPLKLWKNWRTVEKKIRKEINWLRSAINVFRKDERVDTIGCDECFLRQIAILIIFGKVNATEITKAPVLKEFWKDEKITGKKNKGEIYHGSDWHREKMKKIENHFIFLGFKVIREPNLNQGRADLGVYKKGEQDLFIEVGTISLFKLWLNLRSMKNFTYLIVPNDNNLIEFVVKK